jgi:hypothetical protein
MSLRRLRYQLRCATKGHEIRAHLIAGPLVEHRCLRCGAIIGQPTPLTKAATTTPATDAPPTNPEAPPTPRDEPPPEG